MPMKWTPENDQLLFLKILETHDFALDTKRVAEAWPQGENRPTPRAITERLVRMRQMVKASPNNSDSHFSIGKGTASTPRKPRSTPKAAGTTSTGKRKRRAKKRDEYEFDESADDQAAVPIKMEAPVDHDDVAIDTPTKEKKSLQPAFADLNLHLVGTTLKVEPRDDDPFVFGASLPKQVRTASTLPPGMVNFGTDEEDREDEGGTSVWEYHPEDGRREEEGRGVLFAT
ncbi:hypothetical protein BDV59DRAFT_204221 [Aspergillus ambiguus]|uniref:uncharacterized protein n=1 Tax=Aspergillus ambiguus TaxID=176160 RepID=UPI003CCCE630